MLPMSHRRTVAVALATMTLATVTLGLTASVASAQPIEPQRQSFKPATPLAGQPVGRPQDPPAVAPGVHLSPLSPILETAPTAPEQAGPPRAAGKQSDAAKARATAARRRGQCNEILQRATIGELSDADRDILRNHCR